MQYFLISPDGDGHKNLARDEFLLNSLRPGDMALYLYINRNAVIIGRNQNPWRECNLNQLDADGVQLVRRVSGGGAVYHDQGNLNFSFICSADRYSDAEQTGIILKALKRLGIHAEVSGRNDMTIEGRKFSGNAYCQRGSNRQRHGTLLVNAQLGVFDCYLNAPKQKLEAKGVASVRARVCNLCEYAPGLTVEQTAQALREAYEEQYGPAVDYPYTPEDRKEIDRLYARHQSWEWRMGEAPHFDCTFENRFPWGMAQLCLSVENGVVVKARLYTDALDTGIPARVEACLPGVRFEKRALADAAAPVEGVGETLSAYILEKL